MSRRLSSSPFGKIPAEDFGFRASASLVPGPYRLANLMAGRVCKLFVTAISTGGSHIPGASTLYAVCVTGSKFSFAGANSKIVNDLIHRLW